MSSEHRSCWVNILPNKHFLLFFFFYFKNKVFEINKSPISQGNGIFLSSFNSSFFGLLLPHLTIDRNSLALVWREVSFVYSVPLPSKSLCFIGKYREHTVSVKQCLYKCFVCHIKYFLQIKVGAWWRNNLGEIKYWLPSVEHLSYNWPFLVFVLLVKELYSCLATLKQHLKDL